MIFPPVCLQCNLILERLPGLNLKRYRFKGEWQEQVKEQFSATSWKETSLKEKTRQKKGRRGRYCSYTDIAESGVAVSLCTAQTKQFFYNETVPRRNKTLMKMAVKIKENLAGRQNLLSQRRIPIKREAKRNKNRTEIFYTFTTGNNWIYLFCV